MSDATATSSGPLGTSIDGTAVEQRVQGWLISFIIKTAGFALFHMKIISLF